LNIGNIMFNKKDLIKLNHSYYINSIKINSNTMVQCICKKCKKTFDSRLKTLYKTKFDELCINCSRIESTIQKYGVKNISQLKETQNIIKKNNMIKYGVENTTQLDSVKNKIVDTCLKKYGVKNGGGSKIAQDKIKQTMIKKYGSHYFQSEKAIYKDHVQYKSTSSFKTGEYITIFNEKIIYKSFEELKFIKSCEQAYLNVKQGPRIKYILDDKERYYFVDFETDKYLFEIKSSHFWYKQALESGEILAKEKAAKNYAKNIQKEFIFLLDIEDYYLKLEEIYGKRFSCSPSQDFRA